MQAGLSERERWSYDMLCAERDVRGGVRLSPSPM